MKKIFHCSYIVVLVLCTLLLESCKPKADAETTLVDSLTADTTLTAPIEGEEQTIPAVTTLNIIKYNGIVDNDVADGMRKFLPLASLQAQAAHFIHVKDSLEDLRSTNDLTDPADSLIFAPLENEAYQAILAYKKMMAAGSPQVKVSPLIDLVRVTDEGDESFSLLPEITKAGALSHGKFFFLGGAPFLYKVTPEDDAVFKDARGNPETRFQSDITENGNYILNALFNFRNTRTSISYGPPLSSYGHGPQEVKGIGSLIHEFIDRFPVFFLTEKGLVAAQLTTVSVKLVPEYRGCMSDQPNITFSCNEPIEANEILGIYIPFSSDVLTSCVITRHSTALWTADLNADAIPDLACVSGTFEGISSDSMAEVLWFININGSWKIIDHGMDLDCT